MEYIINALENGDQTTKNYHYYKSHYFVRKIGDSKQLMEYSDKNENGLEIVPLENLFDVCYNVKIVMARFANNTWSC